MTAFDWARVDIGLGGLRSPGPFRIHMHVGGVGLTPPDPFEPGW